MPKSGNTMQDGAPEPCVGYLRVQRLKQHACIYALVAFVFAKLLVDMVVEVLIIDQQMRERRTKIQDQMSSLAFLL